MIVCRESDVCSELKVNKMLKEIDNNIILGFKHFLFAYGQKAKK